MSSTVSDALSPEIVACNPILWSRPFTVDPEHPLVSLVAMIGPSPDWFTGVGAINLMENGQWVASRTLDLYAYDSGGDDGTTYKAPDKDTNPKKPTMQATTPHFDQRDGDAGWDGHHHPAVRTREQQKRVSEKEP